MASAMDYFRSVAGSTTTTTVSAPAVNYSASPAPPSYSSGGTMTRTPISYTPAPPAPKPTIHITATRSDAPTGVASVAGGGVLMSDGSVVSSSDAVRGDVDLDLAPGTGSTSTAIQTIEVKSKVLDDQPKGQMQAQKQDDYISPWQPLTKSEREGGVSSGKPIGTVVGTREDAYYGHVEEILTPSGKRIEWSTRWNSDVAGGKAATGRRRKASVSESLSYAPVNPRLSQEQMNEVIDKVGDNQTFSDQSGTVWRLDVGVGAKGEKTYSATRIYSPLPTDPKETKGYKEAAEEAIAMSYLPGQDPRGAFFGTKVSKDSETNVPRGLELRDEPIFITSPEEAEKFAEFTSDLGSMPLDTRIFGTTQLASGDWIKYRKADNVIVGGEDVTGKSLSGEAAFIAYQSNVLGFSSKDSVFKDNDSYLILSAASKARERKALDSEYLTIPKEIPVIPEFQKLIGVEKPLAIPVPVVGGAELTAWDISGKAVRERWGSEKSFFGAPALFAREALQPALKDPIMTTGGLVTASVAIEGALALAPFAVGAGMLGLGVVSASSAYSRMGAAGLGAFGLELGAFMGVHRTISPVVKPWFYNPVEVAGKTQWISKFPLEQRATAVVGKRADKYVFQPAITQGKQVRGEFTDYLLKEYSIIPEGTKAISTSQGKASIIFQGKRVPVADVAAPMSAEGIKIRGTTQFLRGDAADFVKIDVVPVRQPSGAYLFAPVENIPLKRLKVFDPIRTTFTPGSIGGAPVIKSYTETPLHYELATESYKPPVQLREPTVARVRYTSGLGSDEAYGFLTDAALRQKISSELRFPAAQPGAKGTITFPSAALEPYRVLPPSEQLMFRDLSVYARGQAFAAGMRGGRAVPSGKLLFGSEFTTVSGEGIIPRTAPKPPTTFPSRTAYAPTVEFPTEGFKLIFSGRDIRAIPERASVTLLRGTEPRQAAALSKMFGDTSKTPFGLIVETQVGTLEPLKPPSVSQISSMLLEAGKRGVSAGEQSSALIASLKESAKVPKKYLDVPEKPLSPAEIRARSLPSIGKSFDYRGVLESPKTDLFGRPKPVRTTTTVQTPFGTEYVTLQELALRGRSADVTFSKIAARTIQKPFYPAEDVASISEVAKTFKPVERVKVVSGVAPVKAVEVKPLDFSAYAQYARTSAPFAPQIARDRFADYLPSAQKPRFKYDEEETQYLRYPPGSATASKELTATLIADRQITAYAPAMPSVQLPKFKPITVERVQARFKPTEPIFKVAERLKTGDYFGSRLKEEFKLVEAVREIHAELPKFKEPTFTPTKYLPPAPIFPPVPSIFDPKPIGKSPLKPPKPPEPWTPPLPGLPRLPFGRPMASRRRKLARPKRRYQASFAAKMLGIYGTRGEETTGLSFRPMITPKTAKAKSKASKKLRLPKPIGFKLPKQPSFKVPKRARGASFSARSIAKAQKKYFKNVRR